MEIPPTANYYWCTPAGALTFARTGGDDVHYSFIESAQLPSSVTPIIMTLPGADRYNVIVAADFDEFFGLGYHVGWFSLEQVVHEPREAVSYHSQADLDDPSYKIERMQLLRARLGIRPVSLSLDRLAWLHNAFSDLMVVPDAESEA